MAWHAKSTGGYDRASTEGTDNATMLCTALLEEGWSLNSVCALLGNGAGESGLNPWRWESDYVPTVAEFMGWTAAQAQHHGYGLFGFTPASRYINSNNEQTYSRYGYSPNFSDRSGNASDGEAQTRYFITTVSPNWTHNLYSYYYDNFINIGVNIDAFYYMTFQEFITGKDSNDNEYSLDALTGAFELCYEKPADWAAASSYSSRVNNAYYWLNYFNDNPPPVPGQTPDFNIMFYLKPWWKRF